MAKKTGARYLAETLQDCGVSHVFFVPAILLNALAEMETLGIRRIMVHGEKAAAYMADGYARAANKPGVCFGQHIGGSNLAAGLRDAFMARSPVIAFSGGPSPASRYRNAYQEIEDFSQYDATTKMNVRVEDPTRLPDLLQRAFREATTVAPGPVHLELRQHHGDVTLAEGEYNAVIDAKYKSVPPYRTPSDVGAVSEALKLLAAAQRPVIVAGGGVTWSGAQAEVVALAEKLQIPVATSLNAKGTILDTHPLAVGVIGLYSRACANKTVAEADLVFFIGSQTGGQVTSGWKVPKMGTPVIHLDIDAREIGRNYDTKVGLLGDARTVLRQMLEQAGSVKPAPRDAWLARTRALVDEWKQSFAALRASDAVPMRPERLCKEISDALPEDAIVVSDTGHSGIWTGALIEFTKKGQRLIRCAGSLGWGLPGAIGVKCAQPDKTVVCFAGDGGVYYHMAELETAARYGINIVLVVNNNSALNQEIPLVNGAYKGLPNEKGRDIWGFLDVNFAKVAENMGCVGIRVEKPADLPAALKKAITAGKPVVIDVVTDENAMAPTAWTGGAASGH
jgi:acetolactate synthase-1/2/3 large subunit